MLSFLQAIGAPTAAQQVSPTLYRIQSAQGQPAYRRYRNHEDKEVDDIVAYRIRGYHMKCVGTLPLER